MKNNTNAFLLACRIWLLTVVLLLALCVCCEQLNRISYTQTSEGTTTGIAWQIVGLMVGVPLATLPALLILFLALYYLKRKSVLPKQRMESLLSISGGCCVPYAAAVAGLDGSTLLFGFDTHWSFVPQFLLVFSVFFSTAIAAIHILQRSIETYFADESSYSINNQTSIMELNTVHPGDQPPVTQSTNRILIKGVITGVLILVMLIPTAFINDLIKERAERQQSVTEEVSGHWAGAQTINGPYIYLRYNTMTVDSDKKLVLTKKYLVLLPEDLDVSAKITHQFRTRSIYKVLLYEAALQHSGNFNIQLPQDIPAETIVWNESRICYGLSDFKGIEEKLIVHFNGNDYELSPGLPTHDLNQNGLSAPLALSNFDLTHALPFTLSAKIKGSQQLHFLPLSGNSHFRMESAWNSPSFDGNSLPDQRAVSDSGFQASWSFTKNNLPFSTVLRDADLKPETFAFGVTMEQPADGYAKTNRSMKYAILFIGLTFSLFFIMELMQRKPIHPIQYVLIGIALVIFYTLLLSMSEFISFDAAYVIAAVATIGLISLYAKGVFHRWRSGATFGGVLTLLYGFIFVLIRLEDTALLIGSIGLFGILCGAMYASRKINWYGHTPQTNPQ